MTQHDPGAVKVRIVRSGWTIHYVTVLYAFLAEPLGSFRSVVEAVALLEQAGEPIGGKRHRAATRSSFHLVEHHQLAAGQRRVVRGGEFVHPLRHRWQRIGQTCTV